jgi:hypothetical protein
LSKVAFFFEIDIKFILTKKIIAKLNISPGAYGEPYPKSGRSKRFVGFIPKR